MVNALHERPGRARDAAGDGFCARRARVKGFGAQPVIGLAHKLLFERGAFKDSLDQSPPVVPGGRREFGGEGKIVTHKGQNGTVGRTGLSSVTGGDGFGRHLRQGRPRRRAGQR